MQGKTLNFSDKAFLFSGLVEILPKYRKKLITYVRIFGTAILQNKSGLLFLKVYSPFSQANPMLFLKISRDAAAGKIFDATARNAGV